MGSKLSRGREPKLNHEKTENGDQATNERDKNKEEETLENKKDLTESKGNEGGTADKEGGTADKEGDTADKEGGTAEKEGGTAEKEVKTVIALLIATRRFVKRTPREVSVAKGDKLLLLNKKNRDWWTVQVIKNRQQGYVPRSVVARLPTAGAIRSQAKAMLVQVNDPKPKVTIAKAEDVTEKQTLPQAEPGTTRHSGSNNGSAAGSDPKNETENESQTLSKTENELQRLSKTENESHEPVLINNG
ncbi:tyrosine-protein kinase Fyn [Procambarus clarkii]|uniref:tyrosine-protein kinase Fyn n=1 Tax=Procambarus clarkii TaxID=6728 RepID=UPI003742A488